MNGEEKELDRREQDTGVKNRRVMRWTLTHVLWGLFAVDVITLVAAVAVAFKQQDTIDALHDGVCRNSLIIADGLRKDIEQQSNVAAYHQFFPNIPLAQLKALTKEQIGREKDQIQQLTEGCGINPATTTTEGA